MLEDILNSYYHPTACGGCTDSSFTFEFSPVSVIVVFSFMWLSLWHQQCSSGEVCFRMPSS